jgi:tetratricopeptide (TPR) repeat protein
MKTPDVRIRAIVLTLFLVVPLATLVHFWSGQPVTRDSAASVRKTAEDSQVKRHFDWAVSQLRSGHYQQAINGFRAVLEQSPAMPEAHINTGFAHIELAQFDRALHAFQTAIDLRPGQVNAYWGLAVSLEGLCDIPAAIGAMRTYVHLAQPDDPFLVKARAALWEWEQLKTDGDVDIDSIQACKQLPGLQDKS